MQGDARDVCERLCRHDSQNLIEHTRTSSSAPSARAIRMASTIMVERLLTTGKFGGATALAKQIGASQPHLTSLLNMFDLPPGSYRVHAMKRLPYCFYACGVNVCPSS